MPGACGHSDPQPSVLVPHTQPPHTKTPSPCSHPEPAAKISRRDGVNGACDTDTHRLAVTAVTDLTPLLTSGSVKCPIMLHYVHRQGSSASVTAPGPTVVQCGQIQVDIQVKHHPQLMTNSQLTTGKTVTLHISGRSISKSSVTPCMIIGSRLCMQLHTVCGHLHVFS